MCKKTYKRTIRSFVHRQRELSETKQKIFDELMPTYSEISCETVIADNVPLTLEIGFGNGENLFALAKNNLDQNFIGIEVYRPGIANLLALLKTSPLNNIKIYNEDAVLVLQQSIPNNSLDKVLILFPDPWPKKRHHKRRIIQAEFIATLQNKLKPKGVLHIATDCADYAIFIRNILKNNKNFAPLDEVNANVHHRTITTKFEERGKKQGNQPVEMLFMNVGT